MTKGKEPLERVASPNRAAGWSLRKFKGNRQGHQAGVYVDWLMMMMMMMMMMLCFSIFTGEQLKVRPLALLQVEE